MAEDHNNVFIKFEKLRDRLKETIFDQDGAIDEIVDGFIHMAYKPPAESPPRAIFTFLGPPGVGKIFLGRTLTELLPEYSAFKHIDMERFSDPESGNLLLAPHLVQDEILDGELIRFIKEHPRSIVLFESIEKADNQLQLTLLDLITKPEADSGINCKETIFIFTTTLGSPLYQSNEFLTAFKQNKLRAQALVMDAIAQEKVVALDTIESAIAPKLLTTLAQHYVILFNKLTLSSLVRIGELALTNLSDHFMDTSKITLEYKNFPALVRLCTLSLAPAITVKQVKLKLPDQILFKITQYISDTRFAPSKVTFKITKKSLAFLDKIFKQKNLLQQLFKKNQTVDLCWKQYTRGKSLIFSIDRAELRQITPAREYVREERPAVEFSSIGFKDIAGNRHVKTTLKQTIKTLQQPELVKQFGIPMPKGMLLYGPPGVGKTMLGKGFAKEAGLPYVYVSRSDLFDPDYLRLVYLKAREYAPSIVFLDGVDVKGLIEGVYANMPVDQVIMELDALPKDPAESVFTVATAVNRYEVPQLLLEPGRIDTFVEVPELDKEARRFFIEKILKKPNDGKIDVDKVVRYISGMSGYDLQRIGQEASLFAIRHGREVITEEILIEQINIIKYGSRLEKKRIRNLEEDLKMTAYHEAGHAVLSYLLLPEVKIEQVTIAPRLRSLGFISYNFDEFPGNFSKEEIFNNICVLMAGRAASIKKFGDKGIDTGAVSDLEEATHQAYTAIANLGMDEEIGNLHTDTLARNINNRLFQDKVEERLHHWTSEATKRAKKLVEEHWNQIDLLATILIKQEIVDGGELAKIMGRQTPSDE